MELRFNPIQAGPAGPGDPRDAIVAWTAPAARFLGPVAAWRNFLKGNLRFRL
jgi:hypothetical protein